MTYWRWESDQLYRSRPPIQSVTVTAPEPTHELFGNGTIKNYLKMDTDTDDDLIELIQKSIRKQLENELGGVLIVRREVTQKQTGGVETINLLRSPVNSISSVTYYESFDSIGEIVAASDYRFHDGQLYHKDGFWKQGRDGNGYVIVYDAGHVADNGQAAENSLPAIRTAALRLIAYIYENREEFATTISEGNFSVSYNTIVGNSELKSLLAAYLGARAVF